MHIIKSVGVLSVAKILGLVYQCMGMLFAPFFPLFGLIGSVAGQGRSAFAGIFRCRFSQFSSRSVWDHGVGFGRDRRVALQLVRTMGGWLWAGDGRAAADADGALSDRPADESGNQFVA
jgi:hypothetical protein